MTAEHAHQFVTQFIGLLPQRVIVDLTLYRFLECAHFTQIKRVVVIRVEISPDVVDALHEHLITQIFTQLD